MQEERIAPNEKAWLYTIGDSFWNPPRSFFLPTYKANEIIIRSFNTMYPGTILIAFAAGLLQAITGFGGGIMIMTVLPSLVSMNLAPAISGAICAPLSWSIAWKYRKFASLKTSCFPCVVYMIASSIAIGISTRVDMNCLKSVFGLSLALMGVYFMFFSEKAKVSRNYLTAFVCSAASGILGGFFGIGGPFLVLYFLAVTHNKEEYLGSINLLFAIATLHQLLARVYAGILTLGLVPLILAGSCSVLLGRFLGSRIVERMDAGKMKTVIYLFLILSGIMTVINSP